METVLSQSERVYGMLQDPPIHDLVIRPIATTDDHHTQRWIALRETDHILRRFGQADVVRISPGAPSNLLVRHRADEVWVLIDGSVAFLWRDMREDSPTFERSHQTTCHEPTQVLVPFGVAFGIRAIKKPALLIRVSTHVDGSHEDDRVIPAGNSK
jgi:dTDP-4-dehydrorhamnose 3,5-epimerase